MSYFDYIQGTSKNNLLSACKYFKLDDSSGEKLIDEIFEFVSKNWRRYFKEVGLTVTEIASFENAMTRKD